MFFFLVKDDIGGCLFLINDAQIKYEAFLEDISNILNSGEVPNLFKADEKAELLEKLRVIAKNIDRNYDISPESLWDLFIKFCRERLHIIICVSPIGDTFRQRLRNFPALVNCCTIDWFDRWPEEVICVFYYSKIILFIIITGSQCSSIQIPS